MFVNPGNTPAPRLYKLSCVVPETLSALSRQYVIKLIASILVYAEILAVSAGLTPIPLFCSSPAPAFICIGVSIPATL